MQPTDSREHAAHSEMAIRDSQDDKLGVDIQIAELTAIGNEAARQSPPWSCQQPSTFGRSGEVQHSTTTYSSDPTHTKKIAPDQKGTV